MEHDAKFNSLVRQLEAMVEYYGIHNISVAILEITTAKVEECAVFHQDPEGAKNWERCIRPARALEQRALKV